MSEKLIKFKRILIAITIIGVLGAVIPNLLDSSTQAAEKAVIILSFLITIPLVATVVYFIGKKLMKA